MYAIRSYYDMTVGASQYADEILTQSTVTGMSTESLQAYKYAAELIDTPLETLTSTMSKKIKSRITSYNVCYTKLLRYVANAFF